MAETVSSGKGGTKTLTAADVSPQVIRQFKTSLTARRFPALRNLPDADVAQLTHVKRSKEKEDSGRNATGSSAGAASLEGGQDATLRKVPFSPCNPSLAKHAITRKGDIFVGSSSPYDADREEFLNRKELDESKRLGPSPFAPNSASQAKTMISVNYYLNSPDTHQLQADKKLITERISKNSKVFKNWYDTKRRTI